jgi:hypothetical protein
MKKNWRTAWPTTAEAHQNIGFIEHFVSAATRRTFPGHSTIEARIASAYGPRRRRSRGRDCSRLGVPDAGWHDACCELVFAGGAPPHSAAENGGLEWAADAESFFGPDARLKSVCSHLSAIDLAALARTGGRPAGPSPLPVDTADCPGVPEVERTVGRSPIHITAAQALVIAYKIVWRPVPTRPIMRARVG